MDNYIVTTTINYPTVATKKFCKIADKKGWKFIIIGDTKTPHSQYFKLQENYDNFEYITPEEQEQLYPALSQAIGWKSIQRRNIGLLLAYDRGAEIIATVDDDNIPYDTWGDDVMVGQYREIDLYDHKIYNVFDPISPTNHNDLWHRGYPIECVPSKNEIEYKGKTERKVLIQADFWDGDPDIDAICRMEHAPICSFEKDIFPFSSNKFSPFNSQNTFLSRKIIKDYFLFPHIGRMDDIWASYYVESLGYKVAYNEASVYQERNIHDLTIDLKKEIIGYENNLSLLNDLNNSPKKIYNYLPEQSKEAFKLYQKHFL